MTKLAAAARRFRSACRAARDFLARGEEGHSLVEYALTLALISIACIAAISAMTNGLSNAVNTIRNSLP
jgi:Flp pilus assembly pilin Flp